MGGALLGLAVTASGCATAGYLFQAARGQMELFNRARPLEDVLRDERTQPRIRNLLGEVDAIKRFGEEQGLRATPNYRDYVALDRPAVVWVVSACEPLRFKAVEWSFPLVGSFTYLGWFSLDGARGLRDRLAREGWDVDLRGASAYSSLGWFRDPILSTMISEGKDALGELVNVILHESVHATVYVKGQSYFNESLASFVADRMTPVYLEKTRGREAEEFAAYLDSEERGALIRKRFHETYGELESLYGSDRPDADKLARKREILSALREELKYRREITNATLIQHKTYSSGEAEFDALFRACSSDWKRFLAAVGGLRPESFPKAQVESFSEVLETLARIGCPASLP